MGRKVASLVPSPLELLLFFCLLLFLPAAVKGLSFGLSATVTINPIYNLSLNIEILNEVALVGEKTGRLGEIEVDLNYEIIRAKKTVKSGFIGSINVSDYKKSIVQITIPSDMRSGRHTLNITATHPQAYSDSDEDSFLVGKRCAPWQFWCWL